MREQHPDRQTDRQREREREKIYACHYGNIKLKFYVTNGIKDILVAVILFVKAVMFQFFCANIVYKNNT